MTTVSSREGSSLSKRQAQEAEQWRLDNSLVLRAAATNQGTP